jgi:PAS domain S-box-containing protein
MKDQAKTKKQLISELTELRQRIAGLEDAKILHTRTEDKVRETEDYFQSLLFHMHEDIMVIAPDYRIVDVNKAFLATAGRKREEVIGRPCHDIFHGYNEPCEKHGEKCMIREVLETGEPRTCRHQHARADGSKVWVDILLSPRRDEQGNVTHVVQAVRDVTDLITVEKELHDSKTYMESILKAAPVGIGLVHNRVFVWISDRMNEMLGYSEDELLRKSARVAYESDEEFERVGRDKYVEIQERGVGTVETRFKRKDGSVIDILLCSSPIDPADLSKGVIFTALDITERKLAEEAIRESEERFRELAELLPQPVFEMNLEVNFTYSNRCGFETFGYNQDDVEKGLNALEMFIPEERERVQKNIRKTLTGEEFEDHEYTGLGKDGSTFPVLVYSTPIIKKDKPVGVRGIVMDITERKRVEKALEESVENFRALAENANDAILIAAGSKGLNVYANKRAAEITGYGIAELQKIGLHELVAPDGVEKVADRFRRRLNGENVPGQYETSLVKKSGEIFSAELSSARSVWEGQPASIVIFRDITGRKQAEEALRIREAELEIRANELEELNSALRVLLKRREEDQKEIEEKVLSNVKELVLPYVERLKKSALGAEQNTYVNILESNLEDIVSPFVRKLSSTYLGLTPTEIHVANLVKEARDSKTIAQLLNMSPRTVESHRQNIRKKLGLKNKKANLRTHLLSIQ